MKFKKLLLVVLLFVNFCSFGQVTIVSDGLNGTSTLFTLTNGSYYSGNSAAGDRPATSPFFFEGTESRGVSNATATLLSNNIVTTGYTSINMTFKLASFSIGSTGNGADVGDIVTVEVSPDGGTNWYSTVRVLGNNNAYWSYTSGIGIASTSYDGNATPVDFSPTAGGNRTTDGFSTVSVTNLPVSTNLRFRITLLNNTANERWLVDDFIVSGTLAGIESIATGNWSNPATWTGGNVPDSNESAIIKATHTVTMDNATYATRDASTTTTVELGGTLQTGMTYTNNGTTTVNGTFRINAGGFATGNSFVYGAASTLIMNHANSTPYSINGSQAFWPVANPPFNVTVSANSPTRLDMTVGTVAGLLSVSSELNINLANALTVNGTLRINANGFINTNGPIYGSASTLDYRSGGVYGRGFEWNASGIGTIGVTPGYPNNVTIPTAGTVLDYINGAAPGAVGVKAIAGNLTISNATAALHMNYGGVSAGGELIIGGNVLISNGTLTLGQSIGDDLKIGGNFTVTAPNGIFNGNNRSVHFTSTTTLQDITGTALTIPYLVYEPAAFGIRLNGAGTNVTISAPLGGNAITFNSATDFFNINNLNLTIGTTGVANTITGGGTFRGSTTSNLTLLGTGSVGTLTFSGTAAQQTLGTFTVNRTAAAIACLMGSDLTVNTALNLTAGIVDVDNRTMTINNATTVSGAGTNSYIIADNAFGGVLRRQYSVTGTFIFPIGDKTGTMEYSPASVNLTAGTGMTAASYIAVSVNDSKHPDMNAPTHFISRYWTVNRVGTINTPTYTFNGTYLPADINGTETSSFSQFWNGTVWSAVGTILSANTVTYGGATVLPLATTANHFSGGLRSQDINIQQGATNYLTGSTYTFANTPATSFVDVTFTIQNLGNASLTVFANPTVTGSAYSLNPTMPSNVNVPGLSSSTFTIRFTPPTAGTFTGSISIVNNDSDENPYVINFTGNGTGSNASDISRVPASEPTTISSTVIGTISTVTDGLEVWRFNLRDGGATTDADALPTTMTALTITQSAGDQIGNWDETIENIVLVNLNTNTIIANGVVTTNQIQFTGLNVVALDGTSVPLALRMTLKCPLGANAADGDDFGFTISNANVTFDPTGSGKSAFTAQSTANGRLAIAVVPTRLVFTTQPITTGVGSPMSNVVVSAVDACGNPDTGFTGTVSLSSTGTMTGSPLTIAAVGGIATFTGITHTVIGTDLVLTASATGLTAVGSTLFDISTITVLNPGDLAVLAVNTSITSGTDQIVFVCFRDLLPGTSLFLTDNGYERRNANQWGGTEGVITITRTGSVLPKGTIITIETTTPNVTSGTHYDVYTCGAIDTNWTKTAVSGGGVGGFNLNNNDDIYFMQGGTWVNDTAHTSTYNGNVLYGWTESGWQTTVGTTVTGDTAWSTLYPGMECFNTTAPTGDGFVKFNDPDAVDFSSTNRGKFDWIALINEQTNWSSFADNTSYNTGGFDYKASCTNVFIDTDVYVNGRWSGRKDNNWFNCENWDTLIVPDETVDVQIGSSSFVPHPIVDATAPFANYLNFIAKTRNLTITDKKVEIVGNINNKLEVHGDLLIANTVANSALDMNDGNNLTPDGQLYLYGNWTNNKDNDAFDEGNGTVHFLGTSNQIINAVTPLGTESFYNVNLDNDFNTGISNDLHATGNLTLNATRNLTVDSNGYVNVSNQLNSSGTITIQNNGQLIQVNDTDTNIGTYSGSTFNVIRNYTATDEDYVYWSSPTKLFAVNNLPTSYRYEWNPINNNSNGTQGNWVLPTTPNMTFGKGYIARTFNGFNTPTSLPFTFRGQPNNGLISVDISRGTYHGDGITTGLDYTVGASPNPVTVTRWDDNWNLVGNPYPSAINALTFLDEITNPDIEGFVYLWTHQQGLVNSLDPYYYDFGLNYSSAANYVVYNRMGVSSGSSVFNGKIASGQGFFVLMSDGPASTSGKVYFNNSMRYDASSSFAPYNNSQFYRTTSTANNGSEEEKHRLWLDIVSSQGTSNRTLIGYAENATNDKDRMYDAVTNLDNSLRIVSYLNAENPQEFNIQGRGLPFDLSDTVRLGVSIPSNGNYKIGIGSLDGLFAEDQEIYIEDKLLNTIQSIKNQPYNFSSVKGKFTNRFVLRYTNQALGNDDFDRTNQIVAFSNDNLITINSSLEDISEVQIFDVLGRQLHQSKTISKRTYEVKKDIASQTLIIKVKLQNGVWVTKKVLVK